MLALFYFEIKIYFTFSKKKIGVFIKNKDKI